MIVIFGSPTNQKCDNKKRKKKLTEYREYRETGKQKTRKNILEVTRKRRQTLINR